LTENQTLDFCEEQAALDRECFEWGTNVDGKRFDNLWMVWDTNSDNQIDRYEFRSALDSMNIANETDPSNLAVSAYFYRNQYIICRPLRNQVLYNLDKKERQMYRGILDFLAPSTHMKYNIPTKDYDPGFNKIDNGNTFNRTKWDSVVDDIFESMCETTFETDRIGWILKTEPNSNSKKDLFASLDHNGNGEIERVEYKKFYESIDSNGDLWIYPKEVKAWMQDNMDSICAKYRPLMIKNLNEATKEDGYETRALNDVFELLNADDEFPPNVTKDAIMLYDSL